MSSNEDLQSFATAGSGKSEAEVAFDLLNKLKGQGVWGERNKSDILDMYAECLDAARGLRAYAGQNRIEAPVGEAQKTETANTAEPVSIAQPQPTESQMAQPPQHNPVQATHSQPAQPVHAQQQSLQNAYRTS